jgi:hypothetical protein
MREDVSQISLAYYSADRLVETWIYHQIGASQFRLERTILDTVKIL